MPTIPLPAPSSLPDMNDKQDIKQEEQEIPTISQDDINANHEGRIQELEAALMRIRGAI